ncbi:ABC transporter ATP-binding protein [Leptolyngbya sp. AN02str]|uniref:ABC transporter ATP-binding protein n=1 Tax=Leptolyngbya sp. AN02str TaxID=3423363 RepID=UPI003D3175C6
MSGWIQPYRVLLGTYLKPQQRRVLWLAATLLGSIGLQVLNPQLVRDFIDTAVAGGSQQRLVLVALAFVAIALVTQTLAIAATFLSETIAWSATNELRLHLAAHCLRLDLTFHQAHTPGELVERVDGDVDALSRFFSQFVLQVVGNSLLVVGILAVLWLEDWRAGLALSSFVLVAFGILVQLQGLALKPWQLYRQVSAEFYGFVAEHLSGLEDIRANGAVGYVMNRLYRIFREWLAVFHRARFASTLLWSSTVGLFAIGNAIALGIGAYLWSRNAITIGTVYLLFYYTTLLQDPIERIREELEQLQQATASIQRIQSLLAYPARRQPDGLATLPQGALEVTFEHVSFQYESSVSTLHDLSLHLPAGQILGLLGRTGSGKSTLARLLLRLYDIHQGKICLGGVDLAHLAPHELTQHIGFVTQDVQLFQTTIRNNLTFYHPHIPDEQILQTLEELGLLPWLEALPQGLDTELGADSGGLSAGQAQLLALVRVFLKNPGLVILDEASSRLDPLTEQWIERAMDRLLKNRTGIIIAHRLKTVERADQILILEQGQQVEYGDRTILMSNPNSRLSQLWRTASSVEIRSS